MRKLREAPGQRTRADKGYDYIRYSLDGSLYAEFIVPRDEVFRPPWNFPELDPTPLYPLSEDEST